MEKELPGRNSFSFRRERFAGISQILRWNRHRGHGHRGCNRESTELLVRRPAPVDVV